MADIEIRAFGWRFLMVLQRRKPDVPMTPIGVPAMHVQSHGGAFEPNASSWYDANQVELGFRPTRKAS